MMMAAAASSIALRNHNERLWSGRPPEQLESHPEFSSYLKSISTHDSESFSLKLYDTDGVASAGEAGRDGEAGNAGANYGDAGDGAEDIAWIGVIRDHGKQGNISHEGAGVNVGTT